MQSRVFDSPNEKQRQFFLAGTKYVAYGGARGGGKSWALRHKAAMMCLRYRGFRALILRRTYPELRENHILPMLSMLQGIAVYKESQKAFLFPNGSRLRFGYCDAERDVLQYQGQEFDGIFLDEATQFSEYQFAILGASLRGANALPKRFYLTCNPGGIGHDWVKRLFVDREYRGEESPGDYSFIAAKVFDNRALMRRDPGYVETLRKLPEGVRRAWLDGDWDVLEGRYFPEFSRERHVARPFFLPGEWARYFAMDYGLDMLAGYWIAVDEDGFAYVYREIYESGLIISEAAAKIAGETAEQVEQFIAPPDLWNRRQDTGKSAAEIFLEHGIPLTRSDNSRVQGWYALKEWLKPRKNRFGALQPGITVFDCCANLARSLPALVHDGGNPNDAATEPHEITHAPDALRYFVAARPVPYPKKASAVDYTGDGLQRLLRYGQ